MISPIHSLSIRQQSELLDVHRSRYYYQAKPSEDTTELANLITEIYQAYPMFGYRRVHASLLARGIHVNHKRVLKLMQELNLQAIYPKPKTTIRDRSHQVFPYLLRGVEITRPHQALQVDITYLWTPRGFMYLCALIDVCSRSVFSWRLSSTLDTQFCLEALGDAMALYGPPDLVNSDQGCQFTSQDWVGALKTFDIQISMCGAGRSNDNAYIERFWRTLKYEGVFLEHWQTPKELKEGIRRFIHWYNTQRPHQALGYQTPHSVLAGAGASEAPCPAGLVDKLEVASHLKLIHNPTGPTTTLS